MKTLKLTFATIAVMASATSFAQEAKQKPSPEKMFKNLDKDKDGKITKEELEGKKILNRFDKIDKDANGTISLEELTNAMNKQGKGKKAEGDKPKKAKPAHDEDENEDGEE